MLRILLSFLTLVTCALAQREAGLHADEAGRAAFTLGHYKDAIAHFTEAIRQDGSDASLYTNRGNSFAYLGKLEEALKDLNTALKMRIAECGSETDKRLAQLFFCRGFAYYRAGRPEKALIEYDKAIELDPAFPRAHGNAAWILATNNSPTVRNPKKAVDYALKELKNAERMEAALHDTVAAAYAADGKFDAAQREQEIAVKSAMTEAQRRKFSQRLSLYKEDKRYVESANFGQTTAEQDIAPSDR